jgi:NAD(P)-dependent dehydrogenase (short-subunit alcohol dehydrogenase family)
MSIDEHLRTRSVFAHNINLQPTEQQQTTTTMTAFNVKDSVAFVTGTNKANGIGRAIVQALLARGAAKVYATARKASQLDDLVAAHAGKVVAVSLDVTDLDAIAQLATLYPDVTLVVNNAGYVGPVSSIDDLSRSLTELQINYIAPLAIGQSFARVFANLKANDVDTKPSALVNINSIASFVNMPFGATYSASKAAAHSLTQAQRRDLKTSLVIGVYPGPIDTDMTKSLAMDMPSPSSVANDLMNALKNGTEDLVPDAFAQGLYAGWKADAKAMELSMAA